MQVGLRYNIQGWGPQVSFTGSSFVLYAVESEIEQEVFQKLYSKMYFDYLIDFQDYFWQPGYISGD